MVCNEQPDAVLDTFMKLLITVTNKCAPIKKMTVKTVKPPWIDEELKNCKVERDDANKWLHNRLANVLHIEKSCD